MHINACHLIHKVNADGVEGFEVTVFRWVGHSDNTQVAPSHLEKVAKGPFYSIPEAKRYAKSWKDAKSPPPMEVHPTLTVNGCLVETKEDERAIDGVVTIVSRSVEVPSEANADNPNPGPTTMKVERGLFERMKDAVDFAHSWSDIETPPPMPAEGILSEPVVEEASSSAEESKVA